MANFPSLFDSSSKNPFRDLEKVKKQLDRFMNQVWDPIESDLSFNPAFNTNFIPASNIEETDSQYLITLDVPGIKKDDIKIDLRGNSLTISGERREEQEKKTSKQYQSEIAYGTFFRSFNFPTDLKADQINAQYDHGVLKVAVPKIETSRAQTIKISEGKGDNWNKQINSQNSPKQ